MISISYDENSVHNEITITSADPELFDWADPEINYGEPRIEVQVGTRNLQFVLDTREGERTNFTLTGYSVSIKEDAPYASDIEFSLESPQLASEIAASITTYCPIDWQAEDWIVPAEFSFSGKPLDGIQQLASEIGAVVRCQDDGGLLVRPQFPVRPVYMDESDSDINYDRSSLISLSHSETPASGYNAVRVTGQSSDAFVPQLQVEDIVEGDSTRGPYIGETCFVRIFWAGNDASVIDTYATDGLISIVGDGAFYTEIQEEIVEFQEGLASVNLPIYEFSGVEWIGDSGGGISFEQYGTDLQIIENRFRVAKIKYKARYQRYKLSEHYVERLIAVLFLATRPNIAVSVCTVAEPVYGPEIDAPLLTSNSAAVFRAKAWLDQQYRTSECSITVPYNDLAIDGNLAFIDDAQIGNPGNYHITSSEIQIEGPMVINKLGVSKCLSFFSS